MAKAKKPVPQRSFKRSPAPEFFTFQFTHQSVYWIIIGILVLALGAWMLNMTMKVQYIYNQVEQTHVKYNN